jgi:hypothetical protein
MPIEVCCYFSIPIYADTMIFTLSRKQWLTDEANWPVNGEIDIVEGVNYQAEAKTALHATKGCDMFDVPLGTMTGTWDTAVGIPDR